MSLAVKASLGAGALIGGLLLLTTFERPPVDTVQVGFRGLGQEQVFNPRTERAVLAANQLPDVVPQVPAVGPRAGQVYQNVQVLGDVPVASFARTMAAITNWVSPEQGCNYCHNPNNMASDEKYTKVVSRRMLQMTARINAEWKSHVLETGVTCYTCHRGQPVPTYAWARNDMPQRPAGLSGGNFAGQNLATPAINQASLPYDPFTPYLLHDSVIRVQTPAPRITPVRPGIKDSEYTYALMIHMSQSLGVNCTYCHNSRAWYSWEESPPQRTNAWHGVRMVRDLNNNFLEPLQPVFAANRIGPPEGPVGARVGIHGDPLKINCATCHQGVYKPLLGQQMLAQYPELNAVTKIDAPPPIRE